MVAKKLPAVLGNGMTPILCVGETLEEHEQGQTHPKCMGRVEAAMNGLSSEDAVLRDRVRTDLGNRHRQERDARRRQRHDQSDP